MDGRSIASTVWIGIAVAVVAGLSVAVVVESGPLPGEVAVVRRWQSIGPPVPTLADWVRLTTSTQAAIIAGIVPAWFVIRRFGGAGAIAVAILLVTMLVVQPVSKELIDRPRPTEADVDVRAPYTSKSFPSGHSMSTTAVWGTAAILAARHRRWPLAGTLLVPIVSTGAASQVQGVHWPSDALAGTVIGALAACAAASVLLRGDAEQEYSTSQR